MKIGIVGYGSQAKRIIKILKKLKVQPQFIYKPIIRKNDPKFITKDLNLLKKCNTIFICSPNKTHFGYLNIFKKNYIFCEKPLVNNPYELKKIKNNKKLFVNYNYRFGYISKVLEKRNKFKLGKLLGGKLVMTQGLASKNEYKKSWRSKSSKCKYGVFEILGVHLIDLIAFHFDIKKINKNLVNFSNIGSSYDTAFFQIILNSKANISCTVSYFSPFISKQLLIFENGYITMDNKSLQVRGPRNSFDKKGFFIEPPIIYKKDFRYKNDYEYSLENSINFFLKKSAKKEKFEKKHINTSKFTNKLIF